MRIEICETFPTEGDLGSILFNRALRRRGLRATGDDPDPNPAVEQLWRESHATAAALVKLVGVDD